MGYSLWLLGHVPQCVPAWLHHCFVVACAEHPNWMNSSPLKTAAADCQGKSSVYISLISVVPYILYAYTGTSQILSQYNAVATPIDEGIEEVATKTACNRNTGRKRRLQKWTKGSWFYASGRGRCKQMHIWLNVKPLCTQECKFWRERQLGIGIYMQWLCLLLEAGLCT